jgi:hypothetical protein
MDLDFIRRLLIFQKFRCGFQPRITVDLTQEPTLRVLSTPLQSSMDMFLCSGLGLDLGSGNSNATVAHRVVLRPGSDDPPS